MLFNGDRKAKKDQQEKLDTLAWSELIEMRCRQSRLDTQQLDTGSLGAKKHAEELKVWWTDAPSQSPRTVGLTVQIYVYCGELSHRR